MSITNKWGVWRSRWRPRIAIRRHLPKSNPVIQRRPNRRVQQTSTSSHHMNKWFVLLTTCIKTPTNSIDDQEYRVNLYKTQIQKWLNNTNYDIVVVESSGCDSFSEFKCNNRLHVYTTIINACGSSSQGEASSMLYVLDKIKNENFYIRCTHILKVTGRYYLQNIEHILKTYPKHNMNMYVQQHKNSTIRWQNTEYYGIKKELLKDLLEPVANTGYMEHRLYDFIDINRNVCILPSFENDIARGGDGIIINPL
jgi:hypothetical protein